MTTMRLEKFLARAGVASRRGSKALVRSGKVTVNGKEVTEPGASIDDEIDDVRIRGARVRMATRREPRYLLLNKPRGYLCTARDPKGRKTVFELLPSAPGRLFTVGRLDSDAEGLLLVTDDGELAFRLTHPRYKVPKTYIVTVKRSATSEQMERLRSGVWVDGALLAPDDAEIIHITRTESRLRLVVHEGRKHQVKLMCLAVGLPVHRLRRVQFGPIRLSKVPTGGYRPLTSAEVRALRRAVGLETTTRSPDTTSRPRGDREYAEARTSREPPNAYDAAAGKGDPIRS